MVLVDGLIDIGQRLGLDPLAGIDHEQRALTCGQAARDLVGKVHMARRVHQVEDIGLTVSSGVIQPHGLGLDGDAAFLLDIHGIEHLFAHLSLGQAAADLDEPVGQRRFAMIDMGDDRKVADSVARCHPGDIDGVQGIEKREDARTGTNAEPQRCVSSFSRRS